MKEDISLFKYELAIVAILKNEAPYIKEWIDYHLLAGVEHFYLYDNESEDNLKEVLQPYIASGVVEYITFPGKNMQNAAYMDAIQKHRFDCRYIALIDADEFIFPKSDKSIKDVLHEILDGNRQFCSLAVNWRCFGSSNLDKAEPEKGVTDRFKMRSQDTHTQNTHVKTICNPRCVDNISIPHFAEYFIGQYACNENGGIVLGAFNEPSLSNKIVINHYFTKSREEYAAKRSRGRSDTPDAPPKNVDVSNFHEIFEYLNEIFDDGIVRYRDKLRSHDTHTQGAFEDPQRMLNRLFNSMMQKILPGMSPGSPPNQFAGRLHEFLTCRAVAKTLDGKMLDNTSAKFFEELSLKCLLRAMQTSGLEMWQLQLLFQELPSLLLLKYPVVGEIKNACIQILPQVIQQLRLQSNWRNCNRYDYLLRMLKGC